MEIPHSRWCYERGDLIGKVVILTLPDSEEHILDKILALFASETVLQKIEIENNQDLTFGNLIIYYSRRTILMNGKEISLTTREFDVLYFMASHQGQVFTVKQLYENTIHEPYYETFRTVTSVIYNIRKKIGAKAIVNIHGYGYKFNWTYS